jgi:flagellar assembly protein FliH
MSVTPAKFNFDLDLGRREERNRLLSEAAVSAMIAEARAAAHAEGVAAGEQSARAVAAQQLAIAAEAIGSRVSALAASFDDMRKSTLEDAVDLAVVIARKLSATLIDREPTAEIEALVTECMATLDGVPHLVIRCNADLADSVREIANTRVQTSGFAGRLVVMGEPDIAPGDCRLEWVDGGIVRDRAALTAEVDNRIAAFLAARGIKIGASRAGENE